MADVNDTASYKILKWPNYFWFLIGFVSGCGISNLSCLIVYCSFHRKLSCPNCHVLRRIRTVFRILWHNSVVCFRRYCLRESQDQYIVTYDRDNLEDAQLVSQPTSSVIQSAQLTSSISQPTSSVTQLAQSTSSVTQLAQSTSSETQLAQPTSSASQPTSSVTQLAQSTSSETQLTQPTSSTSQSTSSVTQLAQPTITTISPTIVQLTTGISTMTTSTSTLPMICNMNPEDYVTSLFDSVEV